MFGYRLSLTIVLLQLLFDDDVDAIQCFSNSINDISATSRIGECPSMFCIKQRLSTTSFGYGTGTPSTTDAIRYCDGTGALSLCQEYQVTSNGCRYLNDRTELCCCNTNLCNGAIASKRLMPIVLLMMMIIATLLF